MINHSTSSGEPIDAEQLLRLFVDDVRDHALIVIDPMGNVASWNSAAEVVKGFRAEEIIGRHFSCFFSPEDVAAGRPGRELDIALADGRFEGTGYRMRRDGSRFLASVVVSPVRDADGGLRGFANIIRDVTGHNDAANRPQVNETRSRSLPNIVLDTLVDGLITLDHDGIIRSFNPACGGLFGYRQDEVIGRNVSMLMPEPDRSQHDGVLAACRRTGVARIIGRDVAGLRKDGATFPMELAVRETSQGGEHAFVVSIRDLTERRDAESAREQLRQAQKMEAVGQLTGGLAHDFNNLLTIVIGNLDLLRDIHSSDPDADELLRDALEAAVRGADLTRRLLAFARRQPLQPERLDPNAVIANIVRLLCRTLSDDISIELALSPAVWNVRIDRAQLEAAIANLATNARDAMPAGGKLSIATRQVSLNEAYAEHNAEVRPGDYMVVEVTDTGIGIAPDILDRVFEPFFTTKERGKATGLGLSVVFGFMKQSRGHVSVSSAAGSGTTFRLYLPRDDEPLPTPTPAEQSPAAVVGGSETILLVEENASLLRVVARQLSDVGYRVLEAENADTALVVIRDVEPIDLLLTDVLVPGELDGCALSKAALELRPQLKVLLTSGVPDGRSGAQRNQALEGGLLRKPHRKETLLRAVRAALGGA